MKFLLPLVFFFSTLFAHGNFPFAYIENRVLHTHEHEENTLQSRLDTATRRSSKNISLRQASVHSHVAFKSGFTKEAISAIPKGQRPPPNSYLKRKYVFRHIRRFQKEGIVSRIVSKNDYVHFGIGKPDSGKTEFVGLKSEIDFLLSLPLQEQAEKLGIPIEQLQNGNLMRVNFTLSRRYKAHMPTGNEFGANPKWIPGGKLPTGLHEAVIYTEGMTLNVHYFVTNL